MVTTPTHLSGPISSLHVYDFNYLLPWLQVSSLLCRHGNVQNGDYPNSHDYNHMTRGPSPSLGNVSWLTVLQLHHENIPGPG